MEKQDLLIIDGVLIDVADRKYPRNPIEYIPADVKDIGVEAYLSEDVEVDPLNPYLYSVHGSIYRRGRDGDTLIFFSGDFEKKWDELFVDEEEGETICIRRHEGPKPYRMPDNVAYVEIHNADGWNVDEIILSRSFRPTASNINSLNAAHLLRIEVDPNNPWLTSVDGHLYTRDSQRLIL